MATKQEFTNFSEFYPFYLGEHQNQTCRRLHVIGSLSVIALLLYTLVSQQYLLFLLLPILGYGFAWIGHFFFEHNKPATFKYPLYSFMGDWVMLKDVLIGKIKF